MGGLMKYVIVLMFSTFLMSCSHHHKKPEHHHHAYDKQCAYSVAHGDFKTKGSNEYKMKHGGNTYYFSTSQKREQFKKDLEQNIQSADKEWSLR